MEKKRLFLLVLFSFISLLVLFCFSTYDKRFSLFVKRGRDPLRPVDSTNE